MTSDVVLTGFAFVSTGGAASGLPIPGAIPGPELITRWVTPRARRAYLVPHLRPADIVAGLRTRRMGRLSVWALLGSALAFRDAGGDAATIDRSRTAVVCGTAFGCLDLTQEFLGALSPATNKADPILFPETLANQPAGHVARHFGFTGPNLTFSAGSVSGEVALDQAAGLVRAGQADCAVVLAGDELTQSLYEWYEAAGLLDPACMGEPGDARAPRPRTLVPGEGLAACVLETREVADRRGARVYGHYVEGWIGPARTGAGLPDERDARHVVPTGAFGSHGGTGLLELGLALTQLPDSNRGRILLRRMSELGHDAAAILVAREIGA